MKTKLTRCPSTLQAGYSGYSPLAQRDLFGSRTRKISPILPFDPPGKDPALTREYNEKRKRISISGVQEKYSVAQSKNELRLTDTRGSHILKPIPAERLERVEDMPANEHICMQIARQVYQIPTAACGLIFFKDGTPAYITRRFDYKNDGTKLQMEDFATLLGKTPEREGTDYKYNASYLDIANLIHRYVPAASVALMHFYKQVVFNYLIGNGDAHLKNFSLLESKQGDYVLAPAYDLLCTALHINDGLLALHDGLYPGDLEEAGFRTYGSYTRSSFLVFAQKIRLPDAIANSILNETISRLPEAISLLNQSYLSREGKERLRGVMEDRVALLAR